MFNESSDTEETTIRFPYPIVIIISVWLLLGSVYAICRWRRKGKQQYIVPRVFVLCSPRTVQYHYELILRVGLPSSDFNPDKHDIDITVQGLQRNEVVPMTRLNTKTLIDEPLITSLSIIVYRLVEMPQLGTLTLKHSGPFRSCVYAYDFTVIDLATNKEQYYTINQYIGSLNKTYHLDEPSEAVSVHYPIDDVPLPPWTLRDIFLITFTVINCLTLASTLLPINCSSLHNIIVVILASIHGASVVFFLDWFLYYNLRWNQERREYFNQIEARCVGCENVFRIIICVLAIVIGLCALFFSFNINELKDALVWLLVTTNCCIIVIGFWNISRQAEFGEALVAFGLRFRKTDTVYVGLRHHESSIISTIQTKSGSASDEEGVSSSSALSSAQNSQMVRSIGPRSSVKSFGFDLIARASNLTTSQTTPISSATGATPDAQLASRLVQPVQVRKPKAPGYNTETTLPLSGPSIASGPKQAEHQSSKSSSGRKAASGVAPVISTSHRSTSKTKKDTKDSPGISSGGSGGGHQKEKSDSKERQNKKEGSNNKEQTVATQHHHMKNN